MEKNPAFWEWLRNRNKVVQPQEQPRLELPLPMYAPSTEKKEEGGESENDTRGVVIIEL